MQLARLPGHTCSTQLVISALYLRIGTDRLSLPAHSSSWAAGGLSARELKHMAISIHF